MSEADGSLVYSAALDHQVRLIRGGLPHGLSRRGSMSPTVQQ